MASYTIRNLDDSLEADLRLRGGAAWTLHGGGSPANPASDACPRHAGGSCPTHSQSFCRTGCGDLPIPKRTPKHPAPELG